MQFPIMYVEAGSILVLCTEHQLTCNYQAFHHALRVFTSHYLMYLSTAQLSIYIYIYIYIDKDLSI